MKIKKLEMKNWRGFYGSNHVIEFSTNKDKPITVLIGANETGKSDILRAIHWILFDEMPSDTSGPLDLINNYAEKEDKNAIAEATIELISNDKKHFKLTRKLDKDADKGGESTFVAQERDGNSFFPIRNITHQRNWINENILPFHLKDVFLFQGEVLKKAFEDKDNEFITDSVESITGTSYIRDATAYLRKFCEAKDLEKTKKDTKNKNILKQIEKLNTAEGELEKIGAAIIEIEGELDPLNKERNEILRTLTLSNNQEISVAAHEKETAEEAAKKFEGQLDTKKAEFYKQIVDYGCDAFLLNKCIEWSNREEIKEVEQPEYFAEVATPLREQALEKIRDSGTCICGRPIGKKGSEEYDIITAEIEKTNSEEFIKTVRNMDALATTAETKMKTFSDHLSEKRRELEQIGDYLNDEKKKIEDAQKKIDGLARSNFDTRDLNSRLKELETTLIPPLKSRLDEEQFQEKMQKIEINKLKGKIPKSGQGDDPVSNILEIAQELLDTLDEFANGQEMDLSKNLKQNVSEKIEAYGKGDTVEFYENSYLPFLTSPATGVENPKSEGGSALKSICWGTSLIQLATERGDTPGFVENNSPFPFICDAPFSSMDDMKTASATEMLLEIDCQLIILINPSAFREINKNLNKSKKEGSRYFIERKETGKTGTAFNNDPIDIGNDTYQAFYEDSDFEGSLVRSAKI